MPLRLYNAELAKFPIFFKRYQEETVKDQSNVRGIRLEHRCFLLSRINQIDVAQSKAGGSAHDHKSCPVIRPAIIRCILIEHVELSLAKGPGRRQIRTSSVTMKVIHHLRRYPRIDFPQAGYDQWRSRRNECAGQPDHAFAAIVASDRCLTSR